MLRDLKRKAQGFAPAFMGGGGGGGGDVGAAAREAERQARIAQGTQSINDAFTSAFNPDYYGGLSTAYKSNYEPLIQEQYQTALRQLPYQFASTQGSEYQRRVGELERDYQRQLVDNASAADAYANERRSQVEGQRQNLVGQVTAGADPGTAATLAAGAVKSLSSAPTFSALGDLFAKYTGAGANAVALNNAGAPSLNTPISFGQRSGAVTNVNER
mgnify:CR=1 FL=1